MAKKYIEYISTINPEGGATIFVVNIRRIRVSYHVGLSVVCPSGAVVAGCQSLMIFLDASDRAPTRPRILTRQLAFSMLISVEVMSK